MSKAIVTVVTEASTYVYDRIGKKIIRLPGGMGSIDGTALAHAELRKDAEAIPVIQAPEPKVGERWPLLLDIRGDGVLTTRLTTYVRQVTES